MADPELGWKTEESQMNSGIVWRGAHALAWMAFAAGFSWSLRFTLRLAALKSQELGARRATNTSDPVAAREQRQQLYNYRYLRTCYLMAGVIYVTALTYGHAAASEGNPNAGQVLGMLLAYFVVAVVCWSMAATLAPFFESFLMNYNSLLATIVFTMYTLYCNYSTSLDPLRGYHNLERVVSYSLFWVLEDSPLETYWPLLGAAAVMHMVTQLQYSLQYNPSVWVLFVAYKALGGLIPFVCHRILSYGISPSKLPSSIYRLACTSSNLLTLASILLRSKAFKEAMASMAQHAGPLGAALSPLVDPAIPGAQRLPVSLMFSVTGSGLLLVLLSSLLLSVCKEYPASSKSAQAELAKALNQHVLLRPILSFVRGLPTGKRCALCVILTICTLQAAGLGMFIVGLLIGPDDVTGLAPLTLTSFMTGVIVEALGVLYIVLPSSPQPTSSRGGSSVSPLDGSSDVSESMLLSAPSDHMDGVAPDGNAGQLRSRVKGAGRGVDGAGAQGRESKDSMHAGGRRISNQYKDLPPSVSEAQFPRDGAAKGHQGSNKRSSVGDTEAVGAVEPSLASWEEPVDSVTRIEALAHFKSFMQVLNQQPGQYSLDEFIRGAANAMLGVFPQVHHASICLLNNTLTSVNMYTFLGEGAQKPPRTNVPITPGTLLHFVVTNCQPVFISNTTSFPGPYSDVQFMRFVLNLKSVACLPLVVASTRLLGVLRLGFEETWHWTEQEKSMAKQLALVLSSGSHGIRPPRNPSAATNSGSNSHSQPFVGVPIPATAMGGMGPGVTVTTSGNLGPGYTLPPAGFMPGNSMSGGVGGADLGSGNYGPTPSSMGSLPSPQRQQQLLMQQQQQQQMAAAMRLQQHMMMLGQAQQQGQVQQSGVLPAGAPSTGLPRVGSRGVLHGPGSSSQQHGPGSGQAVQRGGVAVPQGGSMGSSMSAGGASGVHGPSAPGMGVPPQQGQYMQSGAQYNPQSTMLPYAPAPMWLDGSGNHGPGTYGGGHISHLAPHSFSAAPAEAAGSAQQQSQSQPHGPPQRNTSTADMGPQQRWQQPQQVWQQPPPYPVSGASGAMGPTSAVMPQQPGAYLPQHQAFPVSQQSGALPMVQQWGATQQSVMPPPQMSNLPGMVTQPGAPGSVPLTQASLLAAAGLAATGAVPSGVMGYTSMATGYTPSWVDATTADQMSQMSHTLSYGGSTIPGLPGAAGTVGFPMSGAGVAAPHGPSAGMGYGLAAGMPSASLPISAAAQYMDGGTPAATVVAAGLDVSGALPTLAGQPGFETAVQGRASDLKMLEVVGRGGFGSVYKAIWRNRMVAVKVLEHGDDLVGCADGGGQGGPAGAGAAGGGGAAGHLDTSGRRAALLEGAMTSTISHPNVVATYDYRVVHLAPTPPGAGLGLSSNSRVLQETHIIMEFCDKGSLQDAMEQGAFLLKKDHANPKENNVDMELVAMTLAEVASAMDYLHTHRITHRDLKPKNVLLRTSTKDRRGFTAKVSDFGLSQVLPETNRTQISQKYSGTVTHMPPELIEDGKVYPQGDVYAFGIMMWEVYTGTTPYANMAHPQIMVAVVTHNLRPKFPDACPEWYKALAYKCWRKDPKLRPQFAEIRSFLMQMVSDRNWQPESSGEPGPGGLAGGLPPAATAPPGLPSLPATGASGSTAGRS